MNTKMLSVERELLSSICDDFEAGQHFKACEGASKLRAILDDKYRAPPINIHCHATNVQIIRNEDGSYTLRNKVDQEQNPKITGRVYSFSADETAPAAQHQGEPVVWVECSPAWLKAGGDCATAPRICVGREGISHLHPAHSSAEQPAPVADQTQCEECKGWGYHENHHEGGGTECGECGGSGKATVAVVMPERMYSDSLPSWAEEQKLVRGWNACLEEVARLNGVKP